MCKKILATGKEDPAVLYPELDLFVGLLDCDNNIIKWTAIDTIGYLANVDDQKIIDKYIPGLFELLNTGKMITANHTISALADIALAKPEYQKKIISELLKVEHKNYDTDECQNIAIGKVILVIGKFYKQLEDKREVIDFLKRQVRNTRNATRKKAELLLNKISK